MAEHEEIAPRLSEVERLKNELYLKKLQMNSLLSITQAINNNVSEEGLYKMYQSFLTWDLSIGRLALFVYNNGRWSLAAGKGIERDLIDESLHSMLPVYEEPKKIKKGIHPFMDHFDFAIPVYHKKQPIAVALIGDNRRGDVVDKIKVITAVTNFLAVALENKRLFRSMIEQQVFEKELQLATEIQQMLLPKHLPDNDRFELARIYRQHSGVGGDFYDFFPLDKDRFAFCIADIAGKGISAAMLMANFQAILKGLVFRDISIQELVSSLNQSIFEVTKGERFITFFLGIVDLSRNLLTYVNAGHIPPLYIHGDEVQSLHEGCLVLGAIEELPGVDVGKVELKHPGMILTFTDGLTDLTNAKGEYLTEGRLKEFAQAHRHLTAREFNEQLFNYALKFKEAHPFPDDITVLTCKIK